MGNWGTTFCGGEGYAHPPSFRRPMLSASEREANKSRAWCAAVARDTLHCVALVNWRDEAKSPSMDWDMYASRTKVLEFARDIASAQHYRALCARRGVTP